MGGVNGREDWKVNEREGNLTHWEVRERVECGRERRGTDGRKEDEGKGMKDDEGEEGIDGRIKNK